MLPQEDIIIVIIFCFRAGIQSFFLFVYLSVCMVIFFINIINNCYEQFCYYQYYSSLSDYFHSKILGLPLNITLGEKKNVNDCLFTCKFFLFFIFIDK